MPRPKRVAFISSNFTWGGSEILWSSTAAALARDGHRISVYKNRLSRRDGNVGELAALSCALVELARFPFLPNQLYSAVAKFMYPMSIGYQAVRLYVSLRLRRRPDLVVISQGGNHDGWLLASMCRRLKLRYVLISQKASDLYWPSDAWLAQIRAVYRDCAHAFFVSARNLRLTEEQLGLRLESASVVRNPFLVPWERRSDWPASDLGVRLACVGRLWTMEKGQDIVLRVLASEKWRSRPVSVTFFGAGQNRVALEGMAAYHGLDNVRFDGFVDDVARIWDDHHGLVLPSRAEGLPLALVEAMLSGRVAIVTDVAGNREVVEDEVTGFVAAAATEAAVDDAMERAWLRRDEWREIGTLAADRIREIVAPDPAGTLGKALLRVAEGEAPHESLSEKVGQISSAA